MYFKYSKESKMPWNEKLWVFQWLCLFRDNACCAFGHHCLKCENLELDFYICFVWEDTAACHYSAHPSGSRPAAHICFTNHMEDRWKPELFLLIYPKQTFLWNINKTQSLGLMKRPNWELICMLLLQSFEGSTSKAKEGAHTVPSQLLQQKRKKKPASTFFFFWSNIEINTF